MAKITLAETAGFCFGVDRAVKMCEKFLDEGRKVATLGPIIHNDRVVGELKERGCSIVGSPEEVPEGTVLVIRSHGGAEGGEGERTSRMMEGGVDRGGRQKGWRVVRARGHHG